jgi:hypothetical protein
MNEKRLIDANALSCGIDGCSFESGYDAGKVLIMIAEAPTVDAVEVVHGKWTPIDVIAKKAGYAVRYYRHAECKVNPCRLFECMNDYCPNCGAKMDGDKS